MQKNTTAQIISFNVSLVSILKTQHKALMSKYKEIIGFIETKDYSKLNQSLKNFNSLTTIHFRDERELYMYLELIISESDGTYRAARKEMKDIAVTIFSIINMHTNTAVNDHTLDQFKIDFALLGKELLGRMRHEEKHLFNDYVLHSS